MNHSRRRGPARRDASRRRPAWSDDPHEDFVINCLAVLYDAAAKFTGGIVTGLYLLLVAIAQLLWAAVTGFAAQSGSESDRAVTRDRAPK